MHKKFWIFLCFAFFYCWPTFAGDARAQWSDPTQLKLKLPPGFYVSANTQFFFVEGFFPLAMNTSIPLPVISVQGTYAWLSTSHLTRDDIDELIRKPLKVIATTNNRTILDSTAVQYAGLLDANYFYKESDLGAICKFDCDVKLWSPTAQNVRLHLFKNSSDSVPSVIFDGSRSDLGVWNFSLSRSYKNYFYLFEVTGFQPLSNKIETFLVTDPYSLSLSINAEKSQLVDLDSTEASPQGWEILQKPFLNSLNDSIIYELHLRDFSAHEPNIAPEYRGTYLAFSFERSFGVQHLKELAQAGLTHVHLLPFNDFGSVSERKSEWTNYEDASSNLQEPQSLIGGMRASDPFNWGYDPVHYFTPDGSYAVDPDGVTRIKEVRHMVAALNGLGLRVIQDVVFNHTYQGGAEPYSVFDKIVPLYYYRVDDEGRTFKSSCCNDTASEHRMMEKLMIDSVLHWARAYKLDGFRFDLMSFHSRSTMTKIREAVRNLTLQYDGVDGHKILLYGEGWSFGSFHDGNPQEAMTIENSYGMQYGFFNDRLRDAVRGGTTSAAEKSDQGFATGLYFDFNQEPANRNTPIHLEDQKGKLLHLGDVIKVGLAGNIADFEFKEHLGHVIRSHDLKFRGAPVAFAKEALETVNYVSAHDGYGLWDAVQAKAPFYNRNRSPNTASSEERRRMHQLAMAIPLLGQGLPFIESGTELLRSKNGDQDSYDSGDFFNRIDWQGQTNYWGAGLPPAWKNLNDWSFWQPRLSAPEMKVSPEQIQRTKEYFKGLLRVRQSSPLFKLNTQEAISQHLSFIDNQTAAEPGLIAMLLQNEHEALLILFNASHEARTFSNESLRHNWKLHPLFDEAVDPLLSQVVLQPAQKIVQIPGRTTVILQISNAYWNHE
ncbi:pullulanase-type alpha-1,6-glucosidase [Bdellovibrio sp. ArHS]|uniref:pullulanase-type alpha-1,6-glucosidase n=1 Tax=Bdellovibrio sp. ArHS TaxID=1569284 RepID=UPI000ADB3099|nr:pullulanase-type alpha-1,6-glucosidase [Bdellovibrio sp. ArHS]